jgi:large subunit ribosomal protein L3
MPTGRRPRKGSLQFYPRKRAAKFIHSVNWKPVSKTVKENGLFGFITYKVGMATAIVKDATPKVMSSGKQIALPVTILEAPPMKIFSVRFYRYGLVVKEVVVSNDKELKHVVKTPKTIGDLDKSMPKEYDKITLLVYSISKQTAIKKTPDLTEIALKADNPLEFIKSLIGKEISPAEFFKYKLIDVRGVTKGKGLQGPVKRFGLSLKQHKSEKGVRRPGSLGPWHPARVTFRAPMSGQMGLFSRNIFNLQILTQAKISDKNINPEHGFKNYGKIKSSYFIVKGSVQGPPKRQILITPAFRPSKEQSKKKLEFLEVITK